MSSILVNKEQKILTIGLRQLMKIYSSYLSLIATIIFTSLAVGLLKIVYIPIEYVLTLLGFIILVLVAIFLVLHPQILLILSVFVFPIEHAELFDVLLPGKLTISKVLGGLLISVLFFNIVFRQKKFRFFDDKLDYFVSLFCAAILISSIASSHVYHIMDEADRIFRLVAFYFAVKNLASNTRMFYILLFVWYSASLYASISGIYDTITIEIKRGISLRVAGINEQPNNFALFSLMVTPIGYYFMKTSQTLGKKFFYFVSLATIISGIFLSGSRGGMVGLFFIMLLIIVQHPKRVQLLLVILILLFFSYPFWPENIRSRYLKSNGDLQNNNEVLAQASTERRISYITYGLELIAKKPFFGSGYRSFSQLYPLSDYAFYNNPLDSEETFRVAHNIYLEIFVGTGLMGFTALIGILISAWHSFNRTAHIFAYNTVPWAIAKALEYSIIGFSIHSIFVSSEQFKQLWFLLGMSSALLYYVKCNSMLDN